MPPGRPDLPLVTLVYVAPPLACLVLVVVSLLRGDLAFAARLAVVLLVPVPLLVHCYRRDFRRPGSG